MNSNLIAVKWNYQKSKTTWNSSLRKTKLWLLYQHTQQTFVLVKTYWRRLQCKIFFVFQDVLKTSWRRLEGINARRLGNTSLETSWRRLGRRKVLRWRPLQDVLKTSWKTRNVCWALTKKASKECHMDGSVCNHMILNHKRCRKINSFLISKFSSYYSV